MNRSWNVFKTAYVAILSVGLLASSEPRSVSSRPELPRDHHLFVGADLFITDEGQRVRVQKIKGNQVLIESPTREYVPLKSTNGITFQMVTKVSANRASIVDYTAEATFTTAENPTAEKGRLQAFLGGQMDVVERSQNAIRNAASDAASLAQNGSTSQVRAAASASQGSMQNELNSLAQQRINMTNIQNSSMQDDELVSGTDETGVNTLRISFTLSSPIDIAEAYVFVAARVIAEDDLFDVSFYRHIGKVSTKPRLILVKQEGFPAGFEIRETEIFLFCQGEEIPTNLSKNHYELTYEEAQEFAKMSHLGDHRIGSAPARPVWSLSPSALFGSGNPAEFPYSLRIDLDDSGQLKAIHEDGQVVPAAAKELIREMTFLPAIENGNPVSSTIVVNLADFYKE